MLDTLLSDKDMCSFISSLQHQNYPYLQIIDFTCIFIVCFADCIDDSLNDVTLIKLFDVLRSEMLTLVSELYLNSICFFLLFIHR